MTGVGGIIGSYTEGELVDKTVYSEIHANENEGERERENEAGERERTRRRQKGTSRGVYSLPRRQYTMSPVGVWEDGVQERGMSAVCSPECAV